VEFVHNEIENGTRMQILYTLNHKNEEYVFELWRSVLGGGGDLDKTM